MWTRTRLTAGAILGAVFGALGSGPVSLALFALLILHQLSVMAWGAWGSEAGAEALSASPLCWALYGVAGLDALAAGARDLPVAIPEWFSRRPARPDLRGRAKAVGMVALDGAWLLVAIGLFVSLAARDRFTLWTAVGELFEGAPGQYLTRAPPRPWSPGPPALTFTMDRVDPQLDGAGALRGLRAELTLNGERVQVGSAWPRWLDGSSLLRASGYGYAPRYEVSDWAGRLLDSSFVKLALLPRGKMDHARSEAFPHRLYFRLAPEAKLRGGEAGLQGLVFDVEVYRGKMKVAGGAVPVGGELRFEGLVLRVPEVRYWAELTLLDDAGLALLLAAALLALLGGLARLLL